MGRILIADDHDSLRRGLARALSDASHDVEEAPNGNAAIEKLHETNPDLQIVRGWNRQCERAGYHPDLKAQLPPITVAVSFAQQRNFSG